MNGFTGLDRSITGIVQPMNHEDAFAPNYVRMPTRRCSRRQSSGGARDCVDVTGTN